MKFSSNGILYLDVCPSERDWQQNNANIFEKHPRLLAWQTDITDYLQARLWLTVTSKFNHSNRTKITADARFQIQRTTTKKQCFKRKMQLNLMWLLFQAHEIMLQYKICYKYFKIIFHNSQLLLWKQNPEFLSSHIKMIWTHRNQA